MCNALNVVDETIVFIDWNTVNIFIYCRAHRIVHCICICLNMTGNAFKVVDKTNQQPYQSVYMCTKHWLFLVNKPTEAKRNKSYKYF